MALGSLTTSDSSSLNGDIGELQNLVKGMFGAMYYVESQMTGRSTSFLDDPTDPFHWVFAHMDGMKNAVEPRKSDLRRVDIYDCDRPKEDGIVVKSYTEAFVDACDRRVTWMLRFVPHSTAASVDRKVDSVWRQRGRIRQSWKFDPQELNNMSESVSWEIYNLTPQSGGASDNDEVASGFHGLIVDYDRRTIGREGHDATVDLSRSAALWATFRVFYEAQDQNASEEKWRAALVDIEWESHRAHKNRLKDELIALGLTIPKRGRRLIDDGT